MELEDRARSSSYKAKNYMKWTETTGENFRRRWNKMVLKLRGFNDTEGEESLANTKKEWLEYCKENNLVYNYNFGDTLA
jgi:ribosomal 30S subunit maturation factor RimM